MRRVGLMGGTFDPVHVGHLLMAEAAYEEFSLDEVRFLPSGRSYFKDSRDEKVLSPEHRLAMTRLAVKDNPHFTVSDMEIVRGGRTYTADTLEQLKAQEPDTVFYFICGADSLVQMHLWYHPEIIFADAVIAAAVRDDQTSRDCLFEAAEALRSRFGAQIEFMTDFGFPVSSTGIRERVRSGRSIRYLVTEPVDAYIQKNSLYRIAEEKK